MLVTQPGIDAAALHHTDSRCVALEELVSTDGEEVTAPSSLGNGGQAFSLTWLVHDQLVWRTDRITSTTAGSTSGPPWRTAS